MHGDPEWIPTAGAVESNNDVFRQVYPPGASVARAAAGLENSLAEEVEPLAQD